MLRQCRSLRRPFGMNGRPLLACLAGSPDRLRSMLRLSLCLLLLGPASPGHANGTTQPIEHIVIVWLKDAGNSEQRRRIIAESEVLRQIPGVIGLRAGEMVPGERAIVDSTFDVALIVSFTDPGALQAYLTHPLHVQLVEETLKPLVDRIRVYDFR
jgi:hypothetical protein